MGAPIVLPSNRLDQPTQFRTLLIFHKYPISLAAGASICVSRPNASGMAFGRFPHAPINLSNESRAHLEWSRFWASYRTGARPEADEDRRDALHERDAFRGRMAGGVQHVTRSDGLPSRLRGCGPGRLGTTVRQLPSPDARRRPTAGAPLTAKTALPKRSSAQSNLPGLRGGLERGIYRPRSAARIRSRSSRVKRTPRT